MAGSGEGEVLPANVPQKATMFVEAAEMRSEVQLLLREALGGHPGGMYLTPHLYRTVVQVEFPSPLICIALSSRMDDDLHSLFAPQNRRGGVYVTSSSVLHHQRHGVCVQHVGPMCLCRAVGHCRRRPCDGGLRGQGKRYTWRHRSGTGAGARGLHISN